MTAVLTTLVSFTASDGYIPTADLIADANGDMFGTTRNGGANGTGTVFEIVNTGSGYASTPTILVSFNGTGGFSQSSLIADQHGDLFGTTRGGNPPTNNGTVFEILNTPSGYASTPTTLASLGFSDPRAGLIADANGDLFGTTFHDVFGGGYGTVFEILNTPSGYASTPTTLVSFNNTDGANPAGSLIADANGDLFGTTYQGGNNNAGTVFEIVKTGSGYASTPTTLVSFNGTDGANPGGSLIADANGNLFGTTNGGTVFEIVHTASGYASTPTTLVNFGVPLFGGLIADANGDLFGTTAGGGDANGDGMVFEIVHTASGYASTPTILISFNYANGSSPGGSLIADAKGDLFGTTELGGAAGGGTVFEITNSGFVIATPTVVADRTGVQVGATVTADAAHGVLSLATDPIAGDTLHVSAVDARPTRLVRPLPRPWVR
jgi:uncharacterized repeat protein (TIGR03803 family)